MNFMAVKSRENVPGFVIHSYFKDRAFKQLQQLKGCQVPKQVCGRGYCLSVDGIRKG